MRAWPLNKLLLSFIVIVSIIILDQVTKVLVLDSNIASICNAALVFGMLSDFPNILISASVLSVFVYFFMKELQSGYSSSPVVLSHPEFNSGSRSRNKFGMTMISSHFIRTVSYALIIGGSFSNIIDRLIRGCVVDFINLGWWPAFNLADAAITAGVGILIFSFVKNPKNPGVSS